MLTFASVHRHLNIGCFICNQFVVEGTSYSSPSCASRQTGQCFASSKSKADFRSSLKEKSSKTREGKLSEIELRTCSKAESFLFCWSSLVTIDLRLMTFSDLLFLVHFTSLAVAAGHYYSSIDPSRVSKSPIIILIWVQCPFSEPRPRS